MSRWTPVSLNLDDGPPAVEWCDLTGERFSDPFFDRTVARLTAGPDARPMVRTPLEALAALDAAPSLDPCGFVFHLGRCGSTLVARQLEVVPGVLALREPRPINSLLEVPADRLGESDRIELLRLLVRALGRVRFGDERRFILKLSSWNVCKASLFYRAFPGVPTVWIQRRPVEVIASMMEAPPGWLALRDRPQKAAWMFNVNAEDLTGIDGFEFAGRLLASMLDAVQELNACVIDYTDLPQAVPAVVAPYLGIDLGDRDRAEMAELARFHAKRLDGTLFTDDSERKRAVPQRAMAVSAALLDERYARLDERRPVSRRW